MLTSLMSRHATPPHPQTGIELRFNVDHVNLATCELL